MEVKSELENKMFEALYPETQILENTEMWTQLKCQRCGETFPDKQSRGRHLRERHGEVKSYMCEVCGKSFSHRSGLTHHIPMHSDVKSFRCNICGKPFRQRSWARPPQADPLGVKAFTCNICGKSFAQGTGLIHHKTTHSSVKIFSCSICGKSFAQSSGLAHHRHIHIKKWSPRLETASSNSQRYSMTAVYLS